MTYRVYEDDPTNRVRVHKATCRFCNDGKGIKGSRLPDNRWHEPFRVLQKAINKAVSTGRFNARGCGHCMWRFHASVMLHTGQNIVVVSKRLGHSNVSITSDIYAHALPNWQRQSAAAFEEAIQQGE